MPLTSVSSDPDALTVTVVGDYPVPVERLWQAFADPRQLERFWGPEDYPATFKQHDFRVGGMSLYVVTGPDGSQHGGWWRFLALERNKAFEIEDGFSKPDGTPDAAMPTTRMRYTFESTQTGSRFTNVARFPSVEAMEQLVKMGMLEGLRSAIGQLDGVLSAPAA
jgi:uncharacterized protein YndB with AHSA1/START domain